MREDLVQHLGLEGIGGVFTGATDEEIESVEKYFKNSLPLDYRNFIKNYGASVFNNDVYFSLIEPSPWSNNGVQTIDVFYGVSKRPGFDLVSIDKRLDGSFPVGMIAIGHDAGASRILLHLVDGHIFFCDKETGNTYLIAKDFTSFLDSFDKK